MRGKWCQHQVSRHDGAPFSPGGRRDPVALWEFWWFWPAAWWGYLRITIPASTRLSVMRRRQLEGRVFTTISVALSPTWPASARPGAGLRCLMTVAMPALAPSGRRRPQPGLHGERSPGFERPAAPPTVDRGLGDRLEDLCDATWLGSLSASTVWKPRSALLL